MRHVAIAATLFLLAGTAGAEMPAELDGFAIHPSGHSYPELVERLDAAIAASPLNKLSAASATVGARNLGQEIPGNMVVHAFAPVFAIRMLDASIVAGYEAPLRFYITENADGTATLAYQPASVVFAPYEDGGEPLKTLAAELETIQTDIAEQAVGE
jgi:uncharacterized protein (DUF302 family)